MFDLLIDGNETIDGVKLMQKPVFFSRLPNLENKPFLFSTVELMRIPSTNHGVSFPSFPFLLFRFRPLLLFSLFLSLVLVIFCFDYSCIRFILFFSLFSFLCFNSAYRNERII